MADAFDDHDSDKQHDQDHAQTVIFAPADLFVHNKAQAARTDIAEDGRIAHVALQAEQGHGQICRQHLREDGGDERAQPRRAEGLQRLIRAHIDRFNDLKELLADIGKREDRNGTGAGHGAETEDIRRTQCADERRQRPYPTQKQAHQKHHNAVRHDVAGCGDGKGDRQHRADEGAEDGHFDGVPQRLPDLAEVGGVRREHRLEDVEELAALFHQHSKVKARDADGKDSQRDQHKQDQRRAAALFLHRRTVRQRIDVRLEDAVVEAHTHSSAPPCSP